MIDWLNPIKERYRGWSEERFLRHHRCDSWKEYERKFDVDYNPRAHKIVEYYHGYPYVYCFENHDHEIYFWDLGRDGMYVTNKWCEEHIKNKFRFDCHRVSRDHDDYWIMDELGGGDYIFAAFKDSKDYVHFMLRWS